MGVRPRAIRIAWRGLGEGVYFGAQYWYGIDSPLNRDLVKRANTAFKANPNYSLVGSYICTKILLDGIIKAGTVDPKKVVAALEGMKYDGLTGPEEVRAGDHQVLKNYYLLRGKMKSADDYADIVSSGPSFLPLDNRLQDDVMPVCRARARRVYREAASRHFFAIPIRRTP